MKVMISGYGRMGHMVEKALAAKGVECAGWTEDVASVDKALAKECVCIDFTVPEDSPVFPWSSPSKPQNCCKFHLKDLLDDEYI